MNIIKAYAVKNLCYITAKKMKPQGIVVHSTGVNNPFLRRYVDAPDTCGVNSYNNHWNRLRPDGREVCVHAFIGYDKLKEVKVAQLLPFDICCWGVGKGSKGSYNYSPAFIQFEICEDSLTDRNYFESAFITAVEFCAELCRKYGIDTNNIVSHKEAYLKGYGSNHTDPEHWMNRFNMTMDSFRARVKNILGETENKPTENNALKKGSLVSISSDAVYYNGKKVPDWVKKQKWYIESISGDRAVIDKNEAKTNSIMSPINIKYLISSDKNISVPFLVKVTVPNLAIYALPDERSAVKGSIKDRGVYTITEIKSKGNSKIFGRLKSGAGFIDLQNTKKI